MHCPMVSASLLVVVLTHIKLKYSYFNVVALRQKNALNIQQIELESGNRADIPIRTNINSSA